MDKINLNGINAPYIPLWALFPLTLLCLAGLLWGMRSIDGRAGRFVLGAIWLRIIFDAFHTFAFQPLVGSFSANAVLSIGTVAVGLFMIDLRNLMLRWLLPFYGLAAVQVISFVFNGDPGALSNVVTKVFYLILITVAVYEALKRNGLARFSSAALWMFGTMFALQAGCIALGVKKMAETDRSLSYVGSFQHEANFSLAMCIGLLPIIFARNLPQLARIALALLFSLFIVLANYRTVLVPIIPFVLLYLGWELWTSMNKRSRPLVTISIVAAGALALAGLGVVASDRMADFYKMASNLDQQIRPLETFTKSERSAGSGRSYIWSYYLNAYDDAKPIRKLVGFGPDAWNDKANASYLGDVGAYPQNQFVDSIFNYGILGLAALCAFVLNLLYLSLRSPPGQRLLLFTLNGVLVMTLVGTMPLWLMEGVLLYGMIGGYVFYSAAQAKAGRTARKAASMRGSMQLSSV